MFKTKSTEVEDRYRQRLFAILFCSLGFGVEILLLVKGVDRKTHNFSLAFFAFITGLLTFLFSQRKFYQTYSKSKNRIIEKTRSTLASDEKVSIALTIIALIYGAFLLLPVFLDAFYRTSP